MGLFTKPDPITPQAKLDRGSSAARILSEEAIMAALDELAAQAQQEWRQSRSADDMVRDVAYRQIAALDALRAQLESWAGEAQMIQANLDKAERRSRAR